MGLWDRRKYTWDHLGNGLKRAGSVTGLDALNVHRITMQESEFLNIVRRRANLDSTEAAREAATAVLRTLGECISDDDAEELATGLPEPLAEPLLNPERVGVRNFGTDEFLDRVRDRVEDDAAEAELRVRAVTAALFEAADEGTLRDILDKLPDEFKSLFEMGGAEQADEFLSDVQWFTDLESPEAAHKATIATLQTLGERISRGEAEDVATYLPQECAEALTESATDDPQDYSVDEFVDRVADQEGVNADEAQTHIQAVTTVLTQTASNRELRNVWAQLPPEYEPLFEPVTKEKFFEAVQHGSNLGSTAATRDVTVATLQTLGEHISEGQEDDLTPALPDELSEALVGSHPRAPESFSFKEFIALVSKRAGIDESAALKQSRVVLDVLAETVGEREIQDTRDQLPDEFDLVFEAGEALEANEFLNHVQQAAGLDSRMTARNATLATLRTLGERLSEGEAADLATYLPKEFADAVTESSTHEPEAYDVDEFVRRVADREGVGEDGARDSIAAVMDVVAVAAGHHEVRKIRSQLPAEFDAFFESVETTGEETGER